MALIVRKKFLNSPAGDAGMVPTYIATTETFTVPVSRQALFAMTIENDGTLIVDGFLIGVD